MANKQSPPPLILVDGSSYLFRAFHALPPLTNSKGEPTGAVVGVVNMLRRLLSDYQPTHMAVVFDAPGPTFRDQLYPNYKAHRPPAPPELKQQIPMLHAVVRALGIPLLMESGVEADDVIGTIATQAAGEVLISTGDKDMAQLVCERISLIDTMSDRLLTPKGVVDRFGVRPDQIIDYLALMGDSSDNIPGVPKCGPKTAVKWLAEYHSLDNLMAHAGEIGGKIGESLRDSLSFLPLSRRLATIKLDVDLPSHADELRLSVPDTSLLRTLYEEMEASRLLATLETTASDHSSTTDLTESQCQRDYQLILDEATFAGWLQRLSQAELFAFDTETTGLDYMQAELVGLSFAIQPGEAAYLPLGHTAPGTPPQLDRNWVLQQLKPLLEDPSQCKVMQNLKFDCNILVRYGITLRGVTHDTMLQSYLLDATSRHDMDSLADTVLGKKTIRFEDIAGKGSKQLSFDQISLPIACDYAAEDADITLQLHLAQWPCLKDQPALSRLYSELEMPVATILAGMERTGVLVDPIKLMEQSHQLGGQLMQLEEQTHALAGHTFNLGSPKQVAQVLFEELQLPCNAKTPTGAYSTAESVLEELALNGHPLPGLILQHRTLSKLKSTYTDKLPLLVDPTTGRIHTSYHQAVTATGRLSSSDPNLQNIPVRSVEGRRIRQAFIARPGYKLVSADYSQIELRIMAHLSGDLSLCRAFGLGEDIHRATAAEVFTQGDISAVSPEQRRSAKAINFGLMYGMSAFGLAQQLEIERGAAQGYINRYFDRYPGVRDFMESTRQLARHQGFVETLFGRRLFLADISSKNANRRAAAERTAINAPLQGSAADIIKRAMIQVSHWIDSEANDIYLLMQVHDELVFEVPDHKVDSAVPKIKSLMESAAELRVPLVVDIGIGLNWDEAH